jgi:hypothetical protein
LRFFSFFSTSRHEEDQLFKVTQGFFGNQDYGYYDWEDKSGSRFLGLISLSIAIFLRLIFIISVLMFFLFELDMFDLLIIHLNRESA